MTPWTNIFLGVIALATLTMAAVQVAAILYGWRISRRVAHQLTHIEEDLKHLLDSVNAVARDAARISALANSQAERVDSLLTDLAARVDATVAAVHDTIVTPLRQGAATLAGVKAVFDLVRATVRRTRGRRGQPDGEEALFIG